MKLDDDDSSVSRLEIFSMLSGDADAASPRASSRAYSLPADLRAVQNSPLNLQSNVGAIPHSPSNISAAPTSVTGLPSQLDLHSSCESDDEYASSDEAFTIASGRQPAHSGRQPAQSQTRSPFGTQHPQYTQHEGKFRFCPAPQQNAGATQAFDTTVLDEETSMLDFLAGHDLPRGMSPVEAQEAMVCRLAKTAADMSHEGLSQGEAQEAIVCTLAKSAADTSHDSLSQGEGALTAQHIRERYPHLFGQSCCTAALPAQAEMDCAQVLQRLSDVAITAGPAGRSAVGPITQEQSPPVVLDKVSTPQGIQSGEVSGMCMEAIDAAASAAEQIRQVQHTEKPSAFNCKGTLRAGPVAIQQGLHAAGLHASPLRQLWQDSNAALVGNLEAGKHTMLCLSCATQCCLCIHLQGESL